MLQRVKYSDIFVRKSTKILPLDVFELYLNITSTSLVPDDQQHNLEMLSITHEDSFPKFIQTVSLSNYVARCLSITRVSFMIQIKSPKDIKGLVFSSAHLFFMFLFSQKFSNYYSYHSKIPGHTATFPAW